MLRFRFIVILLVTVTILLFTGACISAAPPKSSPGKESAAAAPADICGEPLMSVLSAFGSAESKYKEAAESFDTIASAEYGLITASPDYLSMLSTPMADYYYDPEYGGYDVGYDSDDPYGIDRVMLFFHAGHGGPADWDTLGNRATPASMLLGNCNLRYYWQCSCQVFAHGPETCSGTTVQYGCPGNWVSSSVMNIYDRWGPHLDPNLRMACGASTNTECSKDVSRGIWDDIAGSKYDVSDAIIVGLTQNKNYVALCLTIGAENVVDTPLVADESFTTSVNTLAIQAIDEKSAYYHIQYSAPFTIELYMMEPYKNRYDYGYPPLPDAENTDPAEDSVPEALPILLVEHTPPEYRQEEQKLPLDTERSEEEYIQKAIDYFNAQESIAERLVLIEQGREDIQSIYAGPFGTHLRLASTPVDPEKRNPTAPQEIRQKNVVLTFKRRIDLSLVLDRESDQYIVPKDIAEHPRNDAGEPIPIFVLGPGGLVKLQLNNDTSVRNAAIVWRPIKEAGVWAPIISYAEAYTQALEQLDAIVPQPGNDITSYYELERWFWGYWEEAGNVAQSEMRIHYEFWFVPNVEYTSRDYPPYTIVISGQ